MGTWSKHELAELIERGEYSVDARAVAEAIVRRLNRAGSPVLVAPEPFGGSPVLTEEDEAVPRDHLA